jgi:hypothetical protein
MLGLATEPTNDPYFCVITELINLNAMQMRFLKCIYLALECSQRTASRKD